jgi:RimJ/RimL family protein N-acetyltransferase
VVELRRAVRRDLGRFVEQSDDPGARWMAAFGGRRDRAASLRHWEEILANRQVRLRTVVVDGRVAGYVGRFSMFGQPSVAYWYGREFWGRGIATSALRRFLQSDRRRPLYARVAHDNAGSRRVLEKCGFVVAGRARSRAEARGRRLTEYIYRLGPPSAGAGRPGGARRRGPARSSRSGSRGA